MSVQVPGYTTRRVLRSSASTQVVEAERKRDGKRVVAKLFELGDPAVEARVEHEFRLLQDLDVEGVVRPLGLERVGDRLVLVLDYVEGRSLADGLDGRPLGLTPFLATARALAGILARVHERRIIHRDIKPSNVLVGVDGRVHLADFGISVLLESERRHIYDPEVIAGTLPYISPEQTGRTEREVDFRSDLYSLGATFYELLTGRRPFASVEPVELIHAHLARMPEPPRKWAPQLPALLSELVMKLLAKAPEHRYQSARGLLADLDRFASARAAGESEPSFELGARDHALSLQLPHQLYGREAALAELAAELEAVAKAGQRRLLVLDGASGMGKSALLRAFAAPVLARGGHVCVGHFSRDAGDQPYEAFVEILRSLSEELLTLSEERLVGWRRRLRAALGPVAAAVASLVPELRVILGELPQLPELELGEARNRLHLALGRFFAAFTEDGPLVLALDDAHWIDPASLKLLEALLVEVGTGPALFVVGRRREIEHEELDELLAGLGRRGLPVGEIALEALSREDLEHMLAEVLGRAPEELGGLAAIVERKTGNNPMFVRQFLLHLRALDLLEPGEGGWRWDAEAVAAAGVPDDVLGLMQTRLERLPARARAVIERAACVGARFDPALLVELGPFEPRELAEALYTLEAEGLINPSAGAYAFSHERIREAARAGLDGAERRRVHRATGRALLASADREALGERVFEIVDQLDASLGAIPDFESLGLDEDERVELVELNLDAGQRALAAGAWGSARRYLELAAELLGDPAPFTTAEAERRELAFEVHFAHAQALGLAGEFDQAGQAFDELQGWELSDLELARVVGRRVRVLLIQGRMHDSLEVAKQGLDRLGLRLPAKVSTLRMLATLARSWRIVRSADLDTLLALGEVEDERVAAIMHVIEAAKTPAFVFDERTFVWLNAWHAKLVIKHGYHPTAPEGLGQMAFAAAALFGPHEAARLAEAAVDLAEQRATTVGVLLRTQAALYVLLSPQYRPFAEVAPRLEPMVSRSLEAGERENAGYLGALGLAMNLEAGTPIRELLAYAARVSREMESWGSGDMAMVAETTTRFLETLATEDPEARPGFLRFEELAEGAASKVSRYAAAVVETIGAWLIGERDRAWTLAKQILDDWERALFGTWQIPRFAMILAVLASDRLVLAEGGERRRLRALQRKAVRVARRWAKNCPENYAVMAEIAEGEQALGRGKREAALAHLERARQLAADAGVRYLEGLACDRIASLAHRSEWTTIARGAEQAAEHAYRRWGAAAVVRRLRFERGDASVASQTTTSGERARVTSSLGVSLARNPTATADTMASIDLVSVVGTIQAISEDLRLDQVITRVLAAAIENAGADRGALLLEREGVVALVAEGDESEARYLERSVPLATAGGRLAASVVRFVLRTGSPVVIGDVRDDSRFANDPYVAQAGVRSLLCLPIVKQSERVGALVLENRLSSQAFTDERLQVLRMLIGQAASALDNARLYAALGRSEARWRSLVDGVPDIITLMDEHGQVEFINHLLPYAVPAHELVGQMATTHMDPSSRQAFERALAEVVATGDRRELEIRIDPPDGQPSAWYMTRLTPLGRLLPEGAAEADSEGPRGRILSISTDITQRRRAEEERAGLEAQLRQQQRLESIGTLASGVAHEINNPVQGILNYAELIGSHPTDPETVMEFAAEITTESKRVATIVRNLLAFSRQEQQEQLEHVELMTLVEGTLSLIRAVLRKDQILIEVEIARSLPPLRCRTQQIQQVIMNLVTNARDALNERYDGFSDDKRIVIRGGRHQRGGREWVRLSVEDMAGGIPEELRSRIFDPFFTTKGRDQGTGLGLSVSHGIAGEHGGELSVESELGVGSCFHLDLPAVEADGEAEAEGEAEAKPVEDLVRARL